MDRYANFNNDGYKNNKTIKYKGKTVNKTAINKNKNIHKKDKSV